MNKLILILLVGLLPVSGFAQDADDAEGVQAEAQSEPATETATADDEQSSDEADQKPSFPSLAGTVTLKYTCSLNDDTREISTVQDPEGPSSVVYKKAGEEKTVAYAKNDGEYVDRVAEKIKTNLEAANFTCEKPE